MTCELWVMCRGILGKIHIEFILFSYGIVEIYLRKVGNVTGKMAM